MILNLGLVFLGLGIKDRVLGKNVERTKRENHRLVIKLPIGDFDLGIGFCRIGNWGFPES